MPEITIDNQSVTLSAGRTILEAANELGIRIPTLCHDPGLPHANSCMVCLVRDVRRAQFIPACAYPAVAGMVIDASSNEVVAMRREILNLLLREHLGDCEGPCRRGCPAMLDIPAMMRAVAAGDWALAGRLVRHYIPLPLILGTICPEPCAKLCRRRDWDAPLAICRVKYMVGEATVAPSPAPQAASGKSVAVVGGGPAGATAAWYLRLWGHRCRIVEQGEFPWLPLLEKVGRERLSEEVARTDYTALLGMGIDCCGGHGLDSEGDFDALRGQHDAVLLAGGEDMRSRLSAWGVATPQARAENRYATNREGVFVAGGLRSSSRLAAQAVGDGRLAALAIQAFLEGGEEELAAAAWFDSHAGRLNDDHLAQLARNSRFPEKGVPLVSPPDDARQAMVEAGRCMACDCRAKEACKLREYATEYGLGRVQAHPPELEGASYIVRQHPALTFEPGKCIRCGLCARLTEARHERLGLALTGRGRKTRLGVPFGQAWGEAIAECARECVEICPTGALVDQSLH